MAAFITIHVEGFVHFYLCFYLVHHQIIKNDFFEILLEVYLLTNAVNLAK